MRAVLVNGSSNFKFGDMTETFSIQCIDSGKVLSFDSTYTIELIMNFNDQIYNKIVGTILSDNTQVQFSASQFANMPPKEYLCEIQVTDQNENVSIFPDQGFFTLSLNTSASNFSGSLISYITLNNLMQGIHSGKDGKDGKDGAPGATGTVDNTGLTNAPAFQALQAQVNNSAVGTNLLLGTATPVSITGVNQDNQIGNTYALAGGMSSYDLYKKYGDTFTLSYDWSAVDTANAYAGTMQQQFNNAPWSIGGIVNLSSSNTSGHVVCTFNLTNDSANAANGFEFRLNYVPNTSTITVSNMKLEKGSVATDYSLNPAEILTKSDYAKIQAAIVALGGSLS